MSQTQVPATCQCGCAKNTTMLPMTGLGLGFDLSNVPGLIQPGPEGAHLVTRNGQLVWEMPEACEYPAVPDNLYVATDGDDANDGLKPEKPFKTIQAAVDSTRQYPQVGKAITINVATGEYTGNVQFHFNVHYKNLFLLGDENEMPVINGRVEAKYAGQARVKNIHCKDAAYCFHSSHYSRLQLEDCRATGEYALNAHYLATLIVVGTFAIDGSAGVQRGMYASRNGMIVFWEGCEVSAKGSFSLELCVCFLEGSIYFATGCVFTDNGVTGRRYRIMAGSCLSISGGSATFIPGTVDGTVDSNSLFVGV